MVRRLHAAAQRSNAATTNVPFPKLMSALMRGDRFTKPRWLYLPLKAAIMQKDGVAELNAGQRTPARSGGRTVCCHLFHATGIWASQIMTVSATAIPTCRIGQLPPFTLITNLMSNNKKEEMKKWPSHFTNEGQQARAERPTCVPLTSFSLLSSTSWLSVRMQYFLSHVVVSVQGDWPQDSLCVGGPFTSANRKPGSRSHQRVSLPALLRFCGSAASCTPELQSVLSSAWLSVLKDKLLILGGTRGERNVRYTGSTQLSRA